MESITVRGDDRTGGGLADGILIRLGDRAASTLTYFDIVDQRNDIGDAVLSTARAMLHRHRRAR
jgi:hypothetical protein